MPRQTNKPSTLLAPSLGVGIGDLLGRILCGDNAYLLSCFPNECVDLVVTSPPYDDLRTYGGHTWNFDGLAPQLVRVLKPGGVIVWVVNDATVDGSETLTSLRQAEGFLNLGVKVWDTMIFLKQNPSVPTEGRYYNAWEYMFVLSKGKPKTCNWLMKRNKSFGGGRSKETTIGKNNPGIAEGFREYAEFSRRTNAWEYYCGGNAERLHPAPFPESLASDHVQSWSNPGDVVLDPFVGSGTTCKAAKALSREWIGIEINPEYCAIAEARLAQDVLQLETSFAP